MPYKEINDLRKKGLLEQAIQMAENEFSASQDKLEATSLFWCLNDKLKLANYDTSSDACRECFERMQTLFQNFDPQNLVMGKAMAVASEMMLCNDPSLRRGWEIYQDLRISSTTDAAAPLFDEYLSIASFGPCLLHSLILTEAVKAGKAGVKDFNFLTFLQLWNPDNFREEDWLQFPAKEGHNLSSLVEKTIVSYMHALKDHNGLPDQKFKNLLTLAMTSYPGNLHLPRFNAHLMEIEGDRAGAIESLRRQLIRYPDKFYLWEDISMLVEDLDVKIGMMVCAIANSKPENPPLNLRLSLVETLIEHGLYKHASWELNAYRFIINDFHWQLKRKYFDLKALLPADEPRPQCAPDYSEFISKAQDFIYGELPHKIYVKTWEHKNYFGNKSEVSWLLRHDAEETWVKPKKYKISAYYPNGSVFDASMMDSNIVRLQPTRLTADLSWLRMVTAPIYIKRQPGDKTFGFIDNVYVPASMLYGVNSGDEVTAIAIRNEGKRWQALYLYK